MSNIKSGIIVLGVSLAVALLSGCAHRIAFEDVRYSTGAIKQDATVVAVIDDTTLNNTVTIRSFMTGIAHSWDVQPGEMLKQVAEIELPQMFSSYEFSSGKQDPNLTGRRLLVNMTIPSYVFEDFHATITVRAVAQAAGSKVLFDRTYKAEGESKGAKMFWAGAFGMKSSIRQSSLDAYKKIFAEMRVDLAKAVESLPQK